MSVIFISGVYGSGKTTLAEKISTKHNIKCFDASLLISQRTKEDYRLSKVVDDIKLNQNILIEEVKKLNSLYDRILLTGHSVVFAKDYEIETIPTEVFQDLAIDSIVYIEIEADHVYERLSNRAGELYDRTQLTKLIELERARSIEISRILSVPYSSL
jgi:adenylate kinase